MKKIMKHLLITCLIFFFGASCEAQILQRTRFLGFNLNTGGSNSETQNPNNNFRSNNWGLGVSPEFGYFIKDNFAIGVALNYQYNQNKHFYSNGYNYNFSYSYAFLPFIKNYQMLGEKWGLFLQSNIGVRIGKSRDENFTNGNPSVLERKSTQLEFQLATRPGIVYFIRKKWAIEATTGAIGFFANSSRNENQETSETQKSGNFNLNLNWNFSNLNLGVKYYF
jgi:hypothetical protein